MASVRHAYQLLANQIVPHAGRRTGAVPGAVSHARLGGGDRHYQPRPRRDHRQARRLGQLIDDIAAGPPDDADIADLRALLYGLHAVLRLHTAQEDENYLSLAGDTLDSELRAEALVGRTG